jgi:hypothetical protein
VSTNAAIITETAREVTALDISGYLNGVAAHVGGDWAAHGGVRVHTGATGTYYDENNGVVSQQTLRLPSSVGAADVILAIPIIISGSIAGAQGVPPFIIVQPQNIVAQVGQTVQFAVTVISATAPSYEWSNLSGDPVTGGNASNLLFSPVTAEDAGTYQCQVENVYGSTLTNTVVLTIS